MPLMTVVRSEMSLSAFASWLSFLHCTDADVSHSSSQDDNHEKLTSSSPAHL